MPSPVFTERRQHPRHIMVKLCKVRDRRTAMYSPAQTADFSVGGALIRVDRTRPFGPGDEIDLVVAWGDSAVLAAEGMVRAVVRRVIPTSGQGQTLAVEFAEQATQAMAA